MKPKIVVTGGAGFVGTVMVDELKSRYDVVVIDRTTPKVQKVPYLRIDLSKEAIPAKVLRGSECVVHLASEIGVDNTQKHPVRTLTANINSTLCILEACRRNDVQRIIFTSSSEAYGEPLKSPTPESEPLKPMSPYGVSKLACEEYIKGYQKTYGIRFNIARLFNVYGARQSTDFVIPRFVRQALLGRPITIYGDGSSIRSFQYVSDTVGALMLILEKSEIENEVMNLGDDREPTTVSNLAKKIRTLAKSNSRLVYVPFERTERRHTEITRKIPDLSKARKLLRFESKVSLQGGILNTIAFWKRTARI